MQSAVMLQGYAEDHLASLGRLWTPKVGFLARGVGRGQALLIG